ncbi:class I fructose-bisphosphate aldolase [Undibacterium sp. 5I1]|uniref:class I fructose-bisphosphate aldolase n=1 Tax=unclassified Undibacterium TaxID=2630295 RepID=UPI002AB48EBA|nr:MULTISPECIES: class I fructose-bisphosphate aldolase [unclassified Undibacterium]MDY7537850.1 class I fructose-bisphosphate aldolase [Undibacterium sp. 5I1]MEB0232306.1 fructose-bisphosphate aldolase class I [Undibacterium sp. 10I3]MEB0259125.1 fructose-bisphosphate aldolase class I [Undibacterium sp. 5I1]
MNENALHDIAIQLVAQQKGMLAMDESIPTCNARFKALGMAETVKMRRRYRELLLCTPDINHSISGVILCDETFSQSRDDGKKFIDLLSDLNIICGIKVDTGAKDLAGFPGEKLTQGLDGLRERLQIYWHEGARFAKWRAVFKIGVGTPSDTCIASNAQQLAIYAALCQECGLVPVIEPEIVVDGAHTLQQCADVSERVWESVFHQMHLHRVFLEGLILKTNMLLPGSDAAVSAGVNEIAASTVESLLRHVPACVPGIAFLSGGQTPEQASQRLNAINAGYKALTPWPMTFSFSRAIQQPVLATWLGLENNSVAAQQVLSLRISCNKAALKGNYHSAMESAGLFN